MRTFHHRARSPRSEALMARGFWGLALLAIALAGLYTGLVSLSTVNLIVASELEKKVGIMNAAVAEHEGEFIALRGMITPERAREFGFVEVKEKGFAVRTSLTTLTLNQVPQ